MDRRTQHHQSDDVKEFSQSTPDKEGVVWRDSPAEKSLHALGSMTGAKKRRQISNDAFAAIEQNVQYERDRKSMKTNHKVKEKNSVPVDISRHIIFSPEKGIPSHPYHQQSSNLLKVGKVSKHGAQKDDSKRDDQDLLSMLDKISQDYAQVPTSAANITTTPVKRRPIQNKPEDLCGSPLTEESLDILDRMESQATQRRQIQGANVMKTIDISPNGIVEQQKEPDMVLSKTLCREYIRLLVLEIQVQPYQREMHIRAILDSEHVDSKYCAQDNYNMQEITVLLREDWFETEIHVGDIFNLIFVKLLDTGTIRAQQIAQDDIYSIPVHIVDNRNNAIVVHPDILVSPTSVTTNLSCQRRAILNYTLTISKPSGPKALLGSLKHELFENALQSGKYTIEYLKEQTSFIIQNNLLKLIECNIRDTDCMKELTTIFQSIQQWLESFNSISGSVLTNTGIHSKPPSIRLRRVLATEEMMWSTKWGLKGATDASLEVNLVQTGQNIITPFELKTGNRKYSQLDHQGQVILYTLLLNERYGHIHGVIPEGLLLYLPNCEFERIGAKWIHLRHLLQSRNQYAYNVSKLSNYNSIDGPSFPIMLRNRNDCEKCFQLDECVLHHAAMEHGNHFSSKLGGIFQDRTDHLNEVDYMYFKTWIRRLNLEYRQADKIIRTLWLTPNSVGVQQGHCLTDLTLKQPLDTSRFHLMQHKKIRCKSNHLVFERHSNSITRSNYHNGRSSSTLAIDESETKLRVDDHVIISAESQDKSCIILHLARGRITDIQFNRVEVGALSAIPDVIVKGQSTLGQCPRYRLDRDSIKSGLSTSKDNLLQLFIGPSPDLLTVGYNTERIIKKYNSNRGDTDHLKYIGDVRRRELIVRFTPPLFQHTSVLDRITSTDANKNVDVKAQLLKDWFLLNKDQQLAVDKAINAMDYALILGMPGTGKTSTIGYAVRVLLYCQYTVLVTSYTHSAVDTLLLKLHEHKLPILRIGSSSQVHPQIQQYSLDICSSNITSTTELESVLISAPLVGCTCLSTNHALFKKRRFDYVIVDEASQITQPIVLGPLRCAETFILVGDHYQLPPLVVDKEAKAEGMDSSLFKRLCEKYPVACQQLTYQYRMNQDIMVLSNQLVYGNRLKCGNQHTSVQFTKPLKWECAISTLKSSTDLSWVLPILDPANGVCFLNTDHIQQNTAVSQNIADNNDTFHQTNNASSDTTIKVEANVTTTTSELEIKLQKNSKLINPVEGRLLVSIVRILVWSGMDPNTIGIMSPYRSQIQYLQQLLQSVNIVNVEVSTIDKYQGKDKEIILLSFVRSNTNNLVGELLMDWRRLNVAFTRAKYKLICIGSKRTLESSPILNAMFEIIVQNQWMYNIPQYREQLFHSTSFQLHAPPKDFHNSNLNMLQSQVQYIQSISNNDNHGGHDDIEAIVSDTNVRNVAKSHKMKHSMPTFTSKYPIARNILEE